MERDKKIKLLNMAVNFYHELFYKHKKKDLQSQWEVLAKWNIEQLEIKKFKIGYCPETSDFSRHYTDIFKNYPIIKDTLVELGFLEKDEQNLRDSLINCFLFPCFDERGNLLNVAIYHPQKGWQLLYAEDPLGVFGLWQVSYELTDYGLVFLLPDIKSFFSFKKLLYPTGVNPCLACLKGINTLLFEKLETLGVGQVLIIGLNVPEGIQTYMEVITFPDKGDSLLNLKATFPYLADQRFRRLIEVGLEIMKVKKE